MNFNVRAIAFKDYAAAVSTDCYALTQDWTNFKESCPNYTHRPKNM